MFDDHAKVIPIDVPEREYEQLEMFAAPTPFEFRQEARKHLRQRFGEQPFCMRCGTTSGQIQLDHIHPTSLYPQQKYRLDNMQWMCQPCNREKNQMVKDFRRYWD